MASQGAFDLATVTPHPSHKSPPTLGPGKITPAVLIEWEEYAELFFTKDKTEDENKVSSVLSSFTHPSIKNWISMNKDGLRDPDYTFEAFVRELRKNFLDPQWIHHILRNVIYARMAETDNFESYANRILSANNCLLGTDNYLPKAILRDTMENHLAEYLSLKLECLPSSEQEHMIQIKSFEEWMIFMRRLDDSARAEQQRYTNYSSRSRNNARDQRESVPASHHPPPNSSSTAQESRPPFKHLHNSFQPYPSTKPPFATGSNAIQNSRTRVYLPRLTEEEHDVLDRHHGCKKCRRFYVQHDRNTCPNNFPPASAYKPLTTAMAAEVYRASQQPGYDAFHGINFTATAPTTVAPVFTWGGPPASNPIRNSQPHTTRNEWVPRPHHNPTWSPPRRPVRTAEHKSFYVPRPKENRDPFRSFSYPTSTPAATKTHLADELPTAARIEEVQVENVPIPDNGTAAAILPSTRSEEAVQSGGLTPDTEESASDA